LAETNGAAHVLTEQQAENILTGDPISLGYKPTLPVSTMYNADGTPALYMLRDVEVMLTHPQVCLSLDYYKSGIAPAEFEYEASHAAVEDFARKMYECFWTKCLDKVQASYEYGWGGNEALYIVEGGYLTFDGMLDFSPRDSFVLTRRHEYVGVRVKHVEGVGEVELWGPGKTGGYWQTRVEQARPMPYWDPDGTQHNYRVKPGEEIWRANTKFNMPAKGFWFAHRRRYNQWYGHSQLYGAWRPWKRLATQDGAEQVVDGGIYRFAYRGPTVRYPAKDDQPRGNYALGTDMSRPLTNRDKARELAENAKAGVSCALPSTTQDGKYVWDMEWGGNTEGFKCGDLLEYIKYLKDEISYGILVPPELLEASETGSGYSGRAIPMESFFVRQQRNAERTIEAFKEQIADPLIAWNFGPDAWCKVRVKPLLATKQSQARGQDPGQQPGGSQPGEQPPPGGGGPTGAGDPNNPLTQLLQKPRGQEANPASFRLATTLATWQQHKTTTGSPAWRNSATGEIRYQEKMPGEGASAAAPPATVSGPKPQPNSAPGKAVGPPPPPPPTPQGTKKAGLPPSPLPPAGSPQQTKKAGPPPPPPPPQKKDPKTEAVGGVQKVLGSYASLKRAGKTAEALNVLRSSLVSAAQAGVSPEDIFGKDHPDLPAIKRIANSPSPIRLEPVAPAKQPEPAKARQQNSGQPTAPPDQPQILAKVRKETSHRDLHDYMRALTGVNLSENARDLDPRVARQFDAHGTATLQTLTDLLNKGIDPNRSFFTEKLAGGIKGNNEFGSLLRDNSHFVVLSHPGKTLASGGIAGVLVDPLHSPSIPDLQKAFPHVKFVPAKQAAALLAKVAPPGGPEVQYESEKQWAQPPAGPHKQKPSGPPMTLATRSAAAPSLLERRELATSPWIKGSSRTGSTKWTNSATGKVRYQEEQPAFEDVGEDDSETTPPQADAPPIRADDPVHSYLEAFTDSAAEPATADEANVANEELRREESDYRIIPSQTGSWTVASVGDLEDEYGPDWTVGKNALTDKIEVGPEMYFSESEELAGDKSSIGYVQAFNTGDPPTADELATANEELRRDRSKYRIRRDETRGLYVAVRVRKKRAPQAQTDSSALAPASEGNQGRIEASTVSPRLGPPFRLATNPTEWTAYQGPRGGQGWKNPATGVVVYGDKPSEPVSGNVDERAESMLQHAAALPRQALNKAIDVIEGRYAKLEERFGRPGALTILGASVALAAVPVPGTMLVPVALAEAYLRLKALFAADRTELATQGDAPFAGWHWVKLKSKTGSTKWKNVATGAVRYQEEQPGTREAGEPDNELSPVAQNYSSALHALAGQADKEKAKADVSDFLHDLHAKVKAGETDPAHLASLYEGVVGGPVPKTPLGMLAGIESELHGLAHAKPAINSPEDLVAKYPGEMKLSHGWVVISAKSPFLQNDQVKAELEKIGGKAHGFYKGGWTVPKPKFKEIAEIVGGQKQQAPAAAETPVAEAMTEKQSGKEMSKEELEKAEKLLGHAEAALGKNLLTTSLGAALANEIAAMTDSQQAYIYAGLGLPSAQLVGTPAQKAKQVWADFKLVQTAHNAKAKPDAATSDKAKADNSSTDADGPTVSSAGQEQPTQLGIGDEASPQPTVDAKYLHDTYPNLVTQDNTDHNNIWVDAEDGTPLADDLKALGATQSKSQPGKLRIDKSKAQELAGVLAKHSVPFPKDAADLAGLKKVQSLGGTTGAFLVETPSGAKFVQKKGNSAGHIEEEATADKLYQTLGINVPAVKLYQTAEGPVKLAQYVPGQTLKQLMQTSSKSAQEKVFKELRKGFVADALLANYDSIGLEFDNIVIGKDGKVYRIDNGGSLRYRAQGKLKAEADTGDGKAFGDTVPELQTMRDPKINASAAKVFGGISDEEIYQQINDIYNNKDAFLAAVPKALRPKMEKRLQWLKAQVPKASSKEGSAYTGGPDWPSPPTAQLTYTPKPAELKHGLFTRYKDDEARTGLTYQQLPASFRSHMEKVQKSLSPPETAAVKQYTGSHYSTLNTAARKCPQTLDCLGKYKADMDHVEKAIAAAGKMDPPITVWRKISISGNDLKHLLEVCEYAAESGKTFRMPGIKSCSTSTSGWSGNLTFEIRAKTGLSVQKISSHKSEQEFIQGHNTGYRVKGIKEVPFSGMGGKQRIIQLEEI
jgi:hypothetical protein